MIKFDDNLFIQILEQLSEVYPEGIHNDSFILKDFKDRKELMKHLAYSKGKGWILFNETWMSDGSLKINNIRITNMGIDHLMAQSK